MLAARGRNACSHASWSYRALAATLPPRTLAVACLQGLIPAEGHPHDGAHHWLKSAFLVGQPCTLEQVGGGCAGALGLLICCGSHDVCLQAVNAPGCCCCPACCSGGRCSRRAASRHGRKSGMAARAAAAVTRMRKREAAAAAAARTGMMTSRRMEMRGRQMRRRSSSLPRGAAAGCLPLPMPMLLLMWFWPALHFTLL